MVSMFQKKVLLFKMNKFFHKFKNIVIYLLMTGLKDKFITLMYK